MTEPTSGHPDELDHRAFWEGDAYDKWCAAADKVVKTLEISLESLRRLSVRFYSHIPNGRTYRRNLSLETEARHYYPHSVLCLELDEHLRQKSLDAVKKAELAEQLDAITALARMLRDRFPTLCRQHGAGADDIHIPNQMPAFTVSPSTLRRMVRSLPVRNRTNDPNNPVFPVNSPRYPATPDIEIKHGGSYTLIVKDESYNPTGSHKDRWALEKLFQYRDYLEKLLKELRPRQRDIRLQRLSMISSGSAAYALQSLLRLYGLPPLRVVMDKHRSEELVPRLRGIGAIVRLVDLDPDFLSEKRVRELTHNLDGRDITTRDVATPHHECFYDWLACEILMLRPRYVFLPFGTGDLFTNLLEVIDQANKSKRPDPRLEGLSERDLKDIHVFGAIPQDVKTVMDKLYARFRPTEDAVRAKMQALIDQGRVGKQTAIVPVEDKWAVAALKEARGERLNTEHSGIAGLALLRKLEEEGKITLSASDRVVVVNTGWLHFRPD